MVSWLAIPGHRSSKQEEFIFDAAVSFVVQPKLVCKPACIYHSPVRSPAIRSTLGFTMKLCTQHCFSIRRRHDMKNPQSHSTASVVESICLSLSKHAEISRVEKLWLHLFQHLGLMCYPQSLLPHLPYMNNTNHYMH